MTKSGKNWQRAYRSRSVPGSMQVAMKMAEARCKKNGREFSLTLSFLMDVFIRQNGCCAITGRQLVWERWEADNNDLMTIDRKDSSLGYTKENVWLVCKSANIAKNDLTIDEFTRLCRESIKELENGT